MSTDSITADLRGTSRLAQRLWRQCRESSSSYKLLGGSLRTLRNALEEIEDLEMSEEPLTVGPYSAQIAQSRSILEQLDVSLRADRSSSDSNVSERDVADYKTALDVAAQSLTVGHNSLDLGEMPLKLDTAVSSVPGGLSYYWGSATASAVDSAHAERTSSQTSSSYSRMAKDTPWRQSNSSDTSRATDRDRANVVSDEKEVCAVEETPGHLPQATSRDALSAKTPSSDWRSPFASPDPMSSTLERASTLILGSDDSSTSRIPITPAPRTPSLNNRASSDSNIHFSHAQARFAAEQGAPSDARNGDAAKTDPSLRDFNNVVGSWSQPGAQPVVPRRAQSSVAPYQRQGPPLRTSRSQELYDQSSRQRTERSRRYDSSRQQKVGTVPVISNVLSAEPPEMTDDTGRVLADQNEPLEQPRKDLSIVFESPPNEVEEYFASANIDEATKSSDEARNTVASENAAQMSDPAPLRAPPPPPTRVPPPTPIDRKIPKIPRRRSLYRVVNAKVAADSSSDEDDNLYTSSKPASPTEEKQFFDDGYVAHQQPTIQPGQASRTEPNRTAPPIPSFHRSETQRITHAQRVLMARAGYTSPISPTVQSEIGPNGSAQSQTPMSTLSSQSSRAASERHIHPLLRSSTAAAPSDPWSPSSSRSDHTSMYKQPSAHTGTRSHTRTMSYSDRSSSQDWQSASSRPRTADDEGKVVVQGPDFSRGLDDSRLNAPTQEGKILRPEASADDTHKIAYDTPARPRASTEGSSRPSNDLLTPSDALPANNAQSRPSAASHAASNSTAGSDNSFNEWYGSQEDGSEVTDVDELRLNVIVHFWNRCEWAQVESYLNGYLESLVEQGDKHRMRRVRHLLGVCATFQGQWNKAVELFLAVLRAPIVDVSSLDDGDCAAAYWLGDIYALRNQRTEALLCYCIAERSSLFLDPREPTLCECMYAEQTAIRLGSPKHEFKLKWNLEAFAFSNGQSILDANIVTARAAKDLFESEPRRARGLMQYGASAPPFPLDQHKSRSRCLTTLQSGNQHGIYHRLKIAHAAFHPFSPWPMMYDPFFAMGNVQHGRLLIYECDLLAVFNSNPNAKLPKQSSLSLSKIDCFSSNDLNWLIKTIRECLTMLEMEWSEVTNVEGTWFVVRYHFIQAKIAVTHYFSIALFRQSLKLKSAYGVEICPGGICAARIVRSDGEFVMGVHVAESKRVKTIVREYLDHAAKEAGRTK